MKANLKAWCIAVLTILTIVSLIGIIQGVFQNINTVKKARCYAHCLTSYNSGSDVGCHTENCSQCATACETISSGASCDASCHNSSVCQQSCKYIETVINKWSNVIKGDGTVIQKPPVPTEHSKNVTSLTLSWQPGVQNVSSGVVYLLKKEAHKSSSVYRNEYSTVFTEPLATLTIKEVCQSVFTSPAHWPRSISFYFTVVALTENSTLASRESTRIVMTKPDPVYNITVPVFTYHINSSLNKLELTTSINPSPGLSRIATSYGLRWQVNDFSCQRPQAVPPPRIHGGIKDTSKVSLLIFEKLLPCNHLLEVYSQVECVTSDVKTLSYKYPGCQNIPSFDKKFCYSFDPPSSPDSWRCVRNLTHSDLLTDPDFRFRCNITWLPPTYPYAQVKYYDLAYGDIKDVTVISKDFIIWNAERKSGIKTTSYKLSNLLPNIEYKVEVKPTFSSSVTSVAKDITFVTTTKVPSNELTVRDVQVFSLGFSDPYHYSFNITWKRQSFKYGTFERFDFNVKNGNVTKSNHTNLTFVVIKGVQHSESRTFEVTPIYKESWIKGITYRQVINAPDPNPDTLTVGSLGQKGDAVEDKTNNTYTFFISWMPPAFQYKTVDHYQVSYSLSGYPGFAVECNVNSNVKNKRCWAVTKNDTRYTLSGILPREHIVFTVTPVFYNSPYVKGISKTIKIDAPYPRRNLVAVRNLTHDANQQNRTNMSVTSFSWKPPLFKHSAVKQYDIKYSVQPLKDISSNPNTVFRRSVQGNNTKATVETSTTLTTFSLSSLNYGEQMAFQVTPVFQRSIIVGEKSEIVISKPSLPNSTNDKSQSTELSSTEKAGLVIGILLLLLLAIVLIVWFVRRRRKLLKKGLLAGANGVMIDHWEVPIDKIYLEDELGEGAFGKVYKGMLVELPEQSAKYSIAKSIRRKSIKPLYPEDGYVVAIKMLHDFADIEEKREFLKEIQLMKDVGSHRNIVNMLGCGTICEPMFLIVEYLPNGDLLHYLRKRRGKAMQYPDSDPRGPYHSTYCQTYFNKNNPDGGISLQQSRSDRVYVQTPEQQKESKNGEIQLISMQKNEGGERQDRDNSEMDSNQSDNKNPEHEMPEENEEDDILTSGDLMAFAWQVAQGMEYLSKRGYVHRDLAARNVLVGNNKEAKVADFGLTRHMYEDLYQAKTNRKLPLKWMSIEAIFDQSFTSQSDVWAYGVFLWELVTLGGTPYPSINNRELLKLLKEGYRMEKPETCDTELYNIMSSCWREKANDRPTFVDLREKLEEMMTRDNPYFDPSSVDESRDYYNVPSFNSAPEPDDDDDVTEAIFGEASSPREDVKDDEDSNKNTICSPDNKNAHSSGEVALTFENLSFDVNEPDVDLDQVMIDNDNNTDNATRSKPDQKNTKYAKLDFDNIEFNLYRRQNHGLVL